MAELTNQIIDVVEATKWPEDEKQDFYLRWLEDDEAPEFESVHQIKSYCNQYLNNLKRNTDKKARNRVRLEVDNHDTIVNELGLGGEDDDPALLAEAEEQILIKCLSLSAVLLNTLKMYYIEGRSPEEIAKTGNENVEAVRKRITRARNLLQGEVHVR